jgi:hypothetical protein
MHLTLHVHRWLALLMHHIWLRLSEDVAFHVVKRSCQEELCVLTLMTHAVCLVYFA